jgi:hypothetical protein
VKRHSLLTTLYLRETSEPMPKKPNMTPRPPQLGRVQARALELSRLLTPTRDKDWRVECLALGSIAAALAMRAHGLPVDDETFDSLTETVTADLLPAMDRQMAKLALMVAIQKDQAPLATAH